MRIIVFITLIGLSFSINAQVDSLQQEFDKFIEIMERNKSIASLSFDCNSYQLVWISGTQNNNPFLKKGNGESACIMNTHFSKKEIRKREKRIKKHGSHGMKFYAIRYQGDYMVIKESMATGLVNDIHYYYKRVNR